MFRSCRNHFRCFSQMKITKLELFQNALKIILVGTGNVLSPHKYFQFERTLKNVVVNSESAFWVTFWKATCLGFIPKDLGMTWMDWEALMGAPQEVWPATLGAPPWSPSCSLVLPLCPWRTDLTPV